MDRTTSFGAILGVLVGTAAIVGVLGLVATGDAGAEGTTPVANVSDQATVSVTASGHASAEADRVVVAVAVVGTGDTAEEAREQAAADADRLRSSLAAIGYDDEAVRTTGYHLGTDYRREDPDDYRVTHRFVVESDRVEDAGRIVDAAVAGGADRVEGATFTVSEERHRALRSEALAAAMADARADADAIADAAGVAVSGVASVSTGTDYGPVYREVAADAGDGGGTPTVIDGGPVTVRVSVSVTYGID